MAFLAQVSTQQVITKSISTLTLEVSSITGITFGSAFPGFPSTFSTFAILASSINTSTLRIGQWPLDEAANIAINDPTEATTSSGMMVLKMGAGVTNLPSQYVSTTFSTTGSTFTLPIPVNVNNVYVQIWGGGGGGTQNLYARGEGGGGAYLGGYLQVNPNSNLYVIVGKGGQSTLARGTFAEGWGGGTNGGSQSAAGGGFSALFANMSTTTGRVSSFLVIAGAGGGAGYGGGNAGWAAASGTSWTGARMNGPQYRTSFVPGGGYSTGGGAGGQVRAGDGVNINSIIYAANSGGLFFGGTSVTGGGGGGGGYFGGGAGGNSQGDFYDNTGGGAGSSYGDLLKNPVLCNATGRTGGGSTIQGWSFGAGLGGSGTASLPYNSGSNGLVIITYQQPAIGKDKRFIEYRDLNNSTLSYVDSNGSLAIQVSSLVGGYAASIGAPSFMSTLVTDFVQTNQVNASGNLNVGGNAIFQGPTQVSSLTVTTTTLTSTILVGLSPFQSYMAFFGNTGDYNRTVIAEQSNGMVGGGSIQQELLLFRGPNTTDRIRMQTTGYISFEPGVSSRTFPTVPSNVTPAMIINTSSNVGIQTANPLFPLDVTGIARATSLSTLNIQLSTINGQVFGSFSGSTNSLSVGTVTVSSLFALALNVSTTATISSLIVNSLQLGDGNGWVNAGPIQAVALSTIQLNTNDGYINNLFVGIQSTASELQFFGLQGNYNNTVLAEISTGTGTQELLLFKGSSASDRVRVQTTGTFVIETGVSARLFNSNTTQTLSNVTPAFLITASSNVGIQTATPGATLDVAGTARAITVSSQQVNASTVFATVNTSVSSLTSSLFITGTGLARFNGTTSASLYGQGVDTFTVQTSCNAYQGGIASLAFAANTASYPLARIYAVDSASLGSPIGQLIFQTVPVSATTFTSNYAYTGSDQTFTIPSGVTTLQVTLWGAGGAGGSTALGGAGAFTQGLLTVTPGQSYKIIVGGGGQLNAATAAYGGGGITAATGGGGGGGGRSALQLLLSATVSSATGSGTTITFTTNVAHGLQTGQPVTISGLSPSGFNGNFAVASSPSSTQFIVSSTQSGSSSGTGTLYAEVVNMGGGGGGNSVTGTTAAGAATFSGTAFAGAGLRSGGGGSQTAGGLGSTTNVPNGGNGSILQGGFGASSNTWAGGAGGGGYYGGGGASVAFGSGTGSGGGGSSYTSFTLFSLTTGLNSPNSQNQAPGTSVSGYVSGVAAGGATSASGGNGYIILNSIGGAITESMRIGSNGYVGIGTTAPATQLDVAGTARAVTLSSQQLFVSSVNNSLLLGSLDLQSTVQGLGSAGYLSSITSSFLTLSSGNLTTSTVTFLDALNSNTANLVYVQSTFLYFNTTIIGGATQLQPQLFSF